MLKSFKGRPELSCQLPVCDTGRRARGSLMVSMQISADENYMQQITWIFHVTNGPKDHGGMQDEPFEQTSFKRW